MLMFVPSCSESAIRSSMVVTDSKRRLTSKLSNVVLSPSVAGPTFNPVEAVTT